MRSSKTIIIVMMVLLTILFSSGCISDESPSTDSVIVLTDKKPTVMVTASSDRKDVTWYLDGIEKGTVSGSDINLYLNYKDFTTGEHRLKLSDADESVEWKVSVFNEATNSQSAGIMDVNDSRGYDRNTPWGERHRIAKEKINGTKEFTQ